MYVCSLDNHEKVLDLLIEVTENKNLVMTVAQKLEQRGIEKGMQQGMLNTAKKMLLDKEPISKIKKWTGLSDQQITKLKK